MDFRKACVIYNDRRPAHFYLGHNAGVWDGDEIVVLGP